MGSTKKCSKCFSEYHKKLLFCSKCGAIDERRASQIYSLEIKARSDKSLGVRCNKCKSIFPNDQGKCPYCGIVANKETVKSIAFISDDVIKKMDTPIKGHYSGKRLNANNVTTHASKCQMIPCAICEKKISVKAETCPHCGNPTGIHVCPKCNSVNTRAITGTSKATSVFLWGVFAANKVVSKFVCKDCGHKF